MFETCQSNQITTQVITLISQGETICNRLMTNSTYKTIAYTNCECKDSVNVKDTNPLSKTN